MTEYWVSRTDPEYLHSDPECPELGRFKRWASNFEAENLIECQHCTRLVTP